MPKGAGNLEQSEKQTDQHLNRTRTVYSLLYLPEVAPRKATSMPPKQRGDFVCSVCGFRCRRVLSIIAFSPVAACAWAMPASAMRGYDFFGKDPPFGHKAVRCKC